MRYRISRRAIVPATLATMVTLLLAALNGPAADAATSRRHPQPHTLYRIVELRSLGGSTSAGNSINDRGWVTGASNLSGDTATHATLWEAGRTIDLGTLGGPDSAVLWPETENNGAVYGVAETSTPNPYHEAWACSAFFPKTTYDECKAFVWRNGSMTALPTFGGPDGFAAGANNHNEVVGWAEDGVVDPTCSPGGTQVLQFRGALWNGLDRSLTQLPPLPGDSTSAATDINDAGTAVGISGACDVGVGAYSASHAVEWVKNSPIKLPTLGAPAWNTPNAINNRGEIVGFVNQAGTPGAEFAPIAVLWTPRRELRVLGTLQGGASVALGINNSGVIVGQSCSATCSGFVVDRGQMENLQALVVGACNLHIVSANDVNDEGQITGQAVEPRTGDLVTFLATPIGHR